MIECKKCKWAKPSKFFIYMSWMPVVGWLMAYWLWKDAWEFARCHSPKSGAQKILGDVTFCEIERKEHNNPDLCGPSAKFFEPK